MPALGGRRSTALWSAAGAAGVLLLGAAAYGLGSAASGDDRPVAEERPAPDVRPSQAGEQGGPAAETTSDVDGTVTGPTTQASEPTQAPEPTDAPEPLPPPGPLTPVSASATCTSPPAQDTLGITVTYEASRTLDGLPDTAWRCPGSAVGERLVFSFASPVHLASVALVPGYDKVDPVDEIDRFTANRTVTAVSWQFDDGTTVRQDLGTPSRRLTELQLTTPVQTQTVVLEVLATGNDGAEVDHTPVSEVAFTGS